MATEITYAEVRFKSEPTSSGGNAGCPAAPKKTAPHKSNHDSPKLLLVSLLLLFLLLAILFLIVFIVFFQKYSQLLEEKIQKSSVSEMISRLDCVRTSSPMEEKAWSCCPRDWTVFNSSCYYFSADSKSWQESEKNCSGMAAHLVVINSREEQDFITKNLKILNAYYVGLVDPDGQNHWQWVDQTPYTESVAFWHSGEPNDKEERCVILNYRKNQWGWNDARCQGSQNSVCEMKKIYL